MNEILQKIILGIIQGLTEFLPVSSSGHLEIAKALMGANQLKEDSLLTTIILHFGTALSTMVVFWKDIRQLFSDVFIRRTPSSIRFVLAIVVSMIPAVFVGLAFEDQINGMFSGRLLLVGICLLITGGLLLLADQAVTKNKKVSISNGFLIGLAQMVAILPGISRSGSTISASVLLGIDREKAARFSFLMVIPLIFGKIAQDLLMNDVVLQGGSWVPLSIGFVTSFVVGIWACRWMIRLVKQSKLYYFTIYCVFAGVFAISLHYLL